MFVTISLVDNGQFITYLRSGKNSFKPARKYVVLGEVHADAVQELRRLGFQEVVHPRYGKEQREEFLREYIDLIGLIGKEHGSREWWATHIASKNRFVSRIPHHLQKFIVAMETILRRDYDQLIILKPSWVIVDSLKKVLEGHGIDYLCIEDRYSRWREIVTGWSSSILSALYNGFKMFIRSMYVRVKLKDVIGKSLNASKSCYVIKTFIYDHSFSEDGGYRDAFFGTLTEFLKREKQVVIYANILGAYGICLERIKKCSPQTVLPMEAFLSGADIFNAFFRFLFCRIRIQKQAFFCGYNVSDLINNELVRTHHGISFEQYLHYWMTRRLLQVARVETFLLTFESNPWERMCIMAARESSPGTAIIGYQHTVIPQASVNMFPSRNERDIIPMPDRILTVGEAPKEIMERYGDYKKGQIESSCGLRFEYLFKLSSGERKHTGQILVALEGIFEVYKMVNYVLNELERNSHYQVKIRTHPVLPVKSFRHKLVYNLNNVSNFCISNNTSLKDDIEWADVVIYWGTTVALEALSVGKPVIHYEMDSVLSYDPLFECEHLKRVVSDGKPLLPVIEEFYALTDEQYYAERADARRYLDRYFSPITEKGLREFLTARTNDSQVVQ